MSPTTTTTTTTHTDRGEDGPSLWEFLTIALAVELLCFLVRKMYHPRALAPRRAMAQREVAERFARAREEEEEADRLARARFEEEADRVFARAQQAEEVVEANEPTTMTFRELWEAVRSGRITEESLAEYTLVLR